MDDWKPREHDHLVEPVFGGLGARHNAPAEHASPAESRATASRALLVGAALVGALLVLRVAMLLAS
ncbi:MAG: hypothetical protein IT454_01805 [Planctomycetes bacterium]|nr:hypothetical protein [Planctomycetota bacterium]